MEKVWKAEQQDHQEKKRIAELKREIEMEKDREDLQKYVKERDPKDEKKLDWMYKGPDRSINREDYLLGKPIDKNFEQQAQVERDAELNRAPKNHVEHGNYFSIQFIGILLHDAFDFQNVFHRP